MKHSLKILAAAVMFAASLVTFAGTSMAGDGVHKMALQISDNNKQKMTTVLNVAANVSRYYSDKGEQVEIEIVAFNAGLHMLRADTSPVKDRVASFSQSMPNVKFQACGNTLAGMTKKEGKKPPLVKAAHVVPAGAVRLIELNEQGYTIIRP